MKLVYDTIRYARIDTAMSKVVDNVEVPCRLKVSAGTYRPLDAILQTIRICLLESLEGTTFWVDDTSYRQN